jgi:ABC-type nitrate/sulfonate/bicarbonate transport system substrate-binding protein
VLLRNWLRQHRIEPDRDVQIVVVPPAQVYANLKAGHLDGYCVGEPWNSLAVLSKIGWCVSTSDELAARHPEKVLMVRKDFAEVHEPEHVAVIAALIEACQFCQRAENRERLLETIAQPQYVGAPIQSLRMGMAGTFDYGNGRIEKHSDFHIFSGENVNEPGPEKADWVVSNLISSGIVKDATLIPMERCAEWFRADIYAKAALLVSSTSA